VSQRRYAASSRDVGWSASMLMSRRAIS
jgi:hypothetical protein